MNDQFHVMSNLAVPSRCQQRGLVINQRITAKVVHRPNRNLQEKSSHKRALHMHALEFRGLLKSARCSVRVRQKETNADKALGRGFLRRVSLCLTSPYWLLKSLLCTLPTTFSHGLGLFSFDHLPQHTIYCALRGRVIVWWGQEKFDLSWSLRHKHNMKHATVLFTVFNHGSNQVRWKILMNA